MKRIFAFFCALVLFLTGFPGVAVNADELNEASNIDISTTETEQTQLTDFTYTVNADEATITGYTGAGGDITIPSTLDGYPVTTIGEWAFNECPSLTSVTIPNSVTAIEKYAFRWCENLLSASIPDSVITIGDAAFNGCDKLASVTIGNGVTTIGNDAFRGCPSLTSITIPESVTAIGESAFSNCTSLTSLTIPNGVTAISNYLFYYCPNLISVTLPVTLATVGRDAFGECTKLTDVYYTGTENQWKTVSVDTGNECLQNAAVHWEKTDFTYDVKSGEATITGYTGAGGDVIIPDTLGGCPVTAIGEEVFWGCTSMTSVKIPDTVTMIGNYAFCYCTKLTSVTIPDSVKTIGEYAFAGYLDEETGDFASSLTSVTIGSGVTTIGADAFSACGKLTSVTIPDNVTRIDFGAFCFCYGLTSVTIGNGVTAIPDCAFRACDNLTKVTIPASVTTIGESAFENCTKLTDVYYDGTESQWDSISVDTYGNQYLQNATMHFAKQEEPEVTDYTYTVENGKATITGYTGAGGDITIPSTLNGYSVTTIGDRAFSNCISLTSVTIPDSVTSVGKWAFYDCDSLISVMMSENITHLGQLPFYSCNRLTGIWADEDNSSFTSDDRGVLYNKNKTAIIQAPGGISGEYIIPDGVKTVEYGAFSNCENLTAMTIPDSVTSLAYGAFQNCFSLERVVIPDTVTTLGAHAFYDCTSLISAKLPNGITIIGESMFDGCIRLKEIAIPDSVVSIEKWAFYACENLADVTFGNSIASIGVEAFFQCFKLENIVLPDSLTTIGEAAFRDCIGLRNVDLGNGVITIGKEAFYNCYSLTSVMIPKNTASIGEYAFGTCDSLTDIWVDEDNTAYSSDQYGVLFNKDKTILIQAPCGKYNNLTHLNSFAIPDGVLVIGKSAFYDCRLLHALTLPDSLTEVQENAFQLCGNLSYVYYPGSQNRWNEISIEAGNDYLLNSNFNYNHIHNYSLVKPKTVEATCIEEGYVEYTCVYGETNREYTPALGHDYTGAIKTVAPTCTESGISGPTCTYCKEIRPDQVVDALGHNMVAVEAKDATCTQPGNSFGTQCSRCEVYGIQPEIYPEQGHSFTNYKSNDDATCISDGTETAKCDHCEETHTRIEEGSVKGHDHKTTVTQPTCMERGYTTYTCDCGDTYVADYVNAKGHSYLSATCTKPKTCQVCGVTSGKALGHSYKSGNCTRCKYKPAGAKITTQPKNVVVKSGKTAKVAVKASGTGLKYTWYYAKKGSSKYTKVSGSSSSYSVKMSSSVDGRKVYCQITDSYGNVVKSSTVTLYKGTPAKITTQPKGITVANGKTGSISIKASGSSLKYQWYVKYKGASSFTKVGKSSKTYSFTMASKFSGAQAYCVVRDKYGIEVKSSVVTIKLAAKPKIITQPKSMTQVSGKTVKFTVKASGEGLKYQWYYAKKGSSSFKKISGAKSATYSVKVSSSVNGRKYYCLVTDKYGQTVKSSQTTLTMKTVAKITTQPKNVTVKNGKTAKVTIKAVGDGLKYTWYYLKPGATKYVKASATGASYSVKMAAAWKNAKVYCVIADKYGNTVKSKVVTLKMK